MKIELPSTNTVYKTGQCIPLRVIDLPKENDAMVSVNIYPILPFPIAFFSVDNQGEVDAQCLTVFPYKYSYFRNLPNETDLSVDVNGQGSIFLQTAGATSFKFKQELPRLVHVKARSEKNKYVISVYGYNNDWNYIRKSSHIINPGIDVYIPILLGDMIEIDGWKVVSVGYTDSPNNPLFIRGYNDLVNKDVFMDLTMEFADKPEKEVKPYYEVTFVNSHDCAMNILYVDYYSGYLITQIQPHSKYFAFVNKKHPWYSWQCGMKSGYGVVDESGELVI